ncbi:MAG: nucleoside-triphosphatase, partial [Ignavibacteria bacterium]|nr:nucleoside-triphosphatase [Ignavibacteria bacterium]
FAAISGISFLIFCLIRYAGPMRHLKRPSIWIQFALITLIASFLWEWISTGNYFSTKGLIIGLEMNFRALIIIFGFSAIGVELRNPLIRTLLFRNGFSKLYPAMNLAFSALPALISQLPKAKTIARNKQGFLFQLLAQSEVLLEKFVLQTNETRIYIITGEVHEGKTTFVSKLAELLKNSGNRVSGFLSEAVIKNGKHEGYVMHQLEDGKKIELTSIQAVESWLPFRRFWFNPIALKEGNELLMNALKKDFDCIIIDEIGPMELQGDGWSVSLDVLKDKKEGIQFWVVRKNIVPQLIEKWELENYKIVNINTITPVEFSNLLIKKDKGKG